MALSDDDKKFLIEETASPIRLAKKLSRVVTELDAGGGGGTPFDPTYLEADIAALETADVALDTRIDALEAEEDAPTIDSTPRSRRERGWIPAGYATAASTWFAADTDAIVISGTFVVSAALLDANGNYRWYREYTMAAATGSFAGIANTASALQYWLGRLKPRIKLHVRTGGVVTNTRYRMAVRAAGSGVNQAPNDTDNLLGFFGTGGGNWFAHWGDGIDSSGGGLDVGTAGVDTGVAITASTPYTLEIDHTDAANVKWYINGTLVHTQAVGTAGMPSDDTAMALIFTATTLENVAKNIHIGSPIMHSEEA